MPFLERPEARVYYECYGDHLNPVITLINGHTRTHRDFKLISRRLVKQGFFVVTLDNRGSGATEIADESCVTLDAMAGDVQAIWAVMGVSRAIVVGISMGGVIAQKLALSSTAIAGLCLVSTAASSNWLQNNQGSRWGTSFEDNRVMLSRYFSRCFLEKNRLLVDAMAKQLTKSAAEGELIRGGDAQRQAIAAFDFSSQLSDISIPTMIIHGDEDDIIPVQAGEHLAACLTDSDCLELKVLPGKGHLLLAEYPDLADEFITFATKC